jgi:hypothetical protein
MGALRTARPTVAALLGLCAVVWGNLFDVDTHYKKDPRALTHDISVETSIVTQCMTDPRLDPAGSNRCVPTIASYEGTGSVKKFNNFAEASAVCYLRTESNCNTDCEWIKQDVAACPGTQSYPAPWIKALFKLEYNAHELTTSSGQVIPTYATPVFYNRKLKYSQQGACSSHNTAYCYVSPTKYRRLFRRGTQVSTTWPVVSSATGQRLHDHAFPLDDISTGTTMAGASGVHVDHAQSGDANWLMANIHNTETFHNVTVIHRNSIQKESFFLRMCISPPTLENDAAGHPREVITVANMVAGATPCPAGYGEPKHTREVWMPKCDVPIDAANPMRMMHVLATDSAWSTSATVTNAGNKVNVEHVSEMYLPMNEINGEQGYPSGLTPGCGDNGLERTLSPTLNNGVPVMQNLTIPFHVEINFHQPIGTTGPGNVNTDTHAAVSIQKHILLSIDQYDNGEAAIRANSFGGGVYFDDHHAQLKRLVHDPVDPTNYNELPVDVIWVDAQVARPTTPIYKTALVTYVVTLRVVDGVAFPRHITDTLIEPKDSSLAGTCSYYGAMELPDADDRTYFLANSVKAHSTSGGRTTLTQEILYYVNIYANTLECAKESIKITERAGVGELSFATTIERYIPGSVSASQNALGFYSVQSQAPIHVFWFAVRSNLVLNRALRDELAIASTNAVVIKSSDAHVWHLGTDTGAVLASLSEIEQVTLANPLGHVFLKTPAHEFSGASQCNVLTVTAFAQSEIVGSNGQFVKSMRMTLDDVFMCAIEEPQYATSALTGASTTSGTNPYSGAPGDFVDMGLAPADTNPCLRPCRGDGSDTDLCSKQTILIRGEQFGGTPITQANAGTWTPGDGGQPGFFTIGSFCAAYPTLCPDWNSHELVVGTAQDPKFVDVRTLHRVHTGTLAQVQTAVTNNKYCDSDANTPKFYFAMPDQQNDASVVNDASTKPGMTSTVNTLLKVRRGGETKHDGASIGAIIRLPKPHANSASGKWVLNFDLSYEVNLGMENPAGGTRRSGTASVRRSIVPGEGHHLSGSSVVNSPSFVGGNSSWWYQCTGTYIRTAPAGNNGGETSVCIHNSDSGSSSSDHHDDDDDDRMRLTIIIIMASLTMVAICVMICVQVQANMNVTRLSKVLATPGYPHSSAPPASASGDAGVVSGVGPPAGSVSIAMPHKGGIFL